eukprot:TRINITY_DN68034_c0_g1_i1.p1 TRINITY_DN68034_c0_g1~~TRINITY_DN68034_c0_g1_i1.p1  ORF type:complete len:114 (-),score=17.96 TRINITY_DN68034_c0_g1_i1:125-466(-)
MEAVSKALAVFSGDDDYGLLTRTFNPAWMLTPSVLKGSSTDRRALASGLLSAFAQKLSSPRWATLTLQDDVIAQLLVEKAGEIKHNDFAWTSSTKTNADTGRRVRQRRLDRKD